MAQVAKLGQVGRMASNHKQVVTQVVTSEVACECACGAGICKGDQVLYFPDSDKLSCENCSLEYAEHVVFKNSQDGSPWPR